MTGPTNPAGEAMREAVSESARGAREVLAEFALLPGVQQDLVLRLAGIVWPILDRAEAAEAALTTLRADHAEAVANAREPVGDAWDEVRRLEGECRIFLRERDEWKAVADRERADHAAEVARKDEEIARLNRLLGIRPEQDEYTKALIKRTHGWIEDNVEAQRQHVLIHAAALANPEPSHD